MSNQVKSFKNALSDCMMAAAEKDPSIVLLSADSGPNSGFGPFIEKYPDRFYEMGIMEAGAESVASGMATCGLTPIFCAPAPFVTGRPYEFFRIDLGYMHQNVKVIGRNCGFSYSDLGPTHYGLDDIALVRAIPDVMILAPQDAYELEDCFQAMLTYRGPVYMRVHNSALPVPEVRRPFELGKAVIYEEGSDISIISTGNLTPNVLEAVEQLKASGLRPTVVGIHTLRPIDRDAIHKAAETGKIVTVEEHFTVGGLGSIVADICAEACPVRIKRIGAPHIYTSSGEYPDMAQLYGLDAASIAQAVAAFAQA